MTSCLSLSDYIAQANNEQLTASSHYNNIPRADRSRLHTTEGNGNAGAWSSSTLSVGEYIQVDLRTVRRLERVATQGRNNHNQWVTSYSMAYSVDDEHYAYIYNADGSDKVFTGNSDPDTIVQHDFDRAIIARYVRLYPQTWNSFISLRWEVYGCDIGKNVFKFQFEVLHLLNYST